MGFTLKFSQWTKSWWWFGVKKQKPSEQKTNSGQKQIHCGQRSKSMAFLKSCIVFFVSGLILISNLIAVDAFVSPLCPLPLAGHIVLGLNTGLLIVSISCFHELIFADLSQGGARESNAGNATRISLKTARIRNTSRLLSLEHVSYKERGRNVGRSLGPISQPQLSHQSKTMR